MNMRKYFLCLFVFISTLASAEFVNLNVCNQQISCEAVQDSIKEWFNLGNTALVFQYEELDNMGIKHEYFLQCLDGSEIEGCKLAIHSKNGFVKTINGDLMLSKKLAAPAKKISVRKARKIAGVSSSANASPVLIKMNINGADKLFNVYKIYTSDSLLYIDANSGQTIKSLPLRMESTSCSGKTKYSGTKSFKCETSNSNYILYDQSKNIKTLYAHANKAESGTSYYYSSNKTNWTDYYLTSVTVESLANTWWQGFLDNDTYPQLYIAIYDASGSLLYKSDYKELPAINYHCPVTFNISKMIKVPSSGGLVVKFYDYDAISDDLGMTITLGSNTLGDHPWGTATSNVKGYMTITDWHPALDIYWGEIQVYDYYLNVFNRNSFDNNGALMRSFMHNPTSSITNESSMSSYYNNAFAHPGSTPADSYMMFGMGDGTNYGQRVGINTVGHEYTHLISAYRPMGDLEYQGESGAINESMSDIMAKNIEHYVKPSTFSWQYGKDHMPTGKCTRDFADPKKGATPQPSCYQGSRWVDPNSSVDNGGVHYNSGVSNHWYYLLCEGGSGYNDFGDAYNVQAVDIEKAANIVFNMHLYYLPNKPTFLTMRQLTIQVAQILYENEPAIAQSIADAWDAVGVYDTQTTKQQYGILVNGIIEHTASKIPDKDLQGRTQYLVSDVYLQEGDLIECINITEGTTWVIDSLDPYGASQNFVKTARGIECVASGCYSVYLKLAYEDDILYFESGQYCEEPDFVFQEGKYVVVTTRGEKDGYKWYYMTSDLGTANNKRYQATLAGTNYDSIAYTDLESKYIWELVKDGSKWKLKNGNSYSNWTSGNTANFNNSGKQLTLSAVYENIAYLHFYNDPDERFLSLNGTSGNNYFAFYKEKTQVPYLYFIPYVETIHKDTTILEDCKILPFTETFGSSIGEFISQEVSKDAGLTQAVWQWSNQYGMVAKTRYSNVNYASEAWLIAPCVELPTLGVSKLTFDHAARYFSSASTELTLWVSTNYSEGSPATATWQQLTIPTYPAGTNWNFISSGDIDLTSYNGQNIVVAFKYISSASSTPQWEIKNFSITNDNTVTSLEELDKEKRYKKFLLNGQVVIQIDGKIYNTLGIPINNQ